MRTNGLDQYYQGLLGYPQYQGYAQFFFANAQRFPA
jgi:hypothetical protein